MLPRMMPVPTASANSHVSAWGSPFHQTSAPHGRAARCACVPVMHSEDCHSVPLTAVVGCCSQATHTHGRKAVAALVLPALVEEEEAAERIPERPAPVPSPLSDHPAPDDDALLVSLADLETFARAAALDDGARAPQSPQVATC